jgi:hypothetical protein
MKSYSARIADIIARELNTNTQKKFSALLANAQQELYEMSKQTSTVTSSMNVADSPRARDASVRAVPTPTQVESEGVKPLAGASGSHSVTSGMSCGSQLPTPAARPVDRRTLAGSTPGDHRIPTRDGVTSTLDGIAHSGRGPRDQQPGQQNSKNYNEGSGAAFRTTDTGDVGD